MYSMGFSVRNVSGCDAHGVCWFFPVRQIVDENELGDIMKIAVTATGITIDSPMDPRFGRARYILLVDPGSMAVEVMDNEKNVQSFKGAGIQAASAVADMGAEVLLTGYCGPNAFRTLGAAGIKVVQDAGGTVREAVQKFMEGSLAYSEEPNAEGHW